MRTKVDVEEMASGRSPQWEICMGLYGADWCFLIKYLASPSCPTPDHSICKFRYEKKIRTDLFFPARSARRGGCPKRPSSVAPQRRCTSFYRVGVS